MIPVVAVQPGTDEGPRSPRRRFGLDTPMPSDPRIVERAILRHLAAHRPDAVVLGLTGGAEPERPPNGVNLAAGIPRLLLLLPGGRVAFLVVRAQAQALSRAERAFADLCRTRAVPVHVVRSLAEARRALDDLGLPSGEPPCP